MGPGALGDARGERAPAAADFQHPFAAAESKQIDHTVEFAQLGLLEAFPGRGVDCGRIGHAGIEPETIELVAEIIMGGDVPTAAAPGVAVERMTKLGPWQRRLQSLQGRHLRGTTRSGAEECMEVRRRPFSRQIAFGKAEIAAGQKAQHAAPAMDRQMRLFAGALAADQEPPSTRRLQQYLATVDAAKHALHQRRQRRLRFGGPFGLDGGRGDVLAIMRHGNRSGDLKWSVRA